MRVAYKIDLQPIFILNLWHNVQFVSLFCDITAKMRQIRQKKKYRLLLQSRRNIEDCSCFEGLKMRKFVCISLMIAVLATSAFFLVACNSDDQVVSTGEF